MIPNRANEKNVTRKGFLSLTPQKRPRTPNTGTETIVAHLEFPQLLVAGRSQTQFPKKIFVRVILRLHLHQISDIQHINYISDTELQVFKIPLRISSR